MLVEKKHVVFLTPNPILKTRREELCESRQTSNLPSGCWSLSDPTFFFWGVLLLPLFEPSAAGQRCKAMQIGTAMQEVEYQLDAKATTLVSQLQMVPFHAETDRDGEMISNICWMPGAVFFFAIYAIESY